MLKIPLFLLAYAMCIVAVAAAPQTDESKAVEIRLGATLPLTGDAASYGTLIKDGIALAVSELQQEGYRISVVYEDVPLPGTPALTAIQRLINVEHIHALVGNFWNPAIPVMAPEIMSNKILTFHSAAADDLILDAGDLIFCTNSRIRDEGYRLADYAYNTLHAKTASILYIATTFGDTYQRHFKERFEALGGRVLVSDYSKLNDPDVRPQLLKVLYKKSDIFFAGYFGTNLGLVLRQAGQVGIKQKILGVYEAEDPSVLEVAGDYGNGLRFFIAEAPKDHAAFEKFRAKFIDAYHYEPRILASNAYDATRIAVRALAQCTLDAECAKERIYAIRNYEGASGVFSIGADGGASKKFILKGIENKRFVLIGESSEIQ
jgi:branched-chain amino acid transport system substrate-binding protein